jgi:oligogalacturonide transport system permease protein
MKNRMRLNMRTRHYVEGYSFIAIWVIGFLLFLAIPLARSLYYSFHKMVITKTGLQASYIGLKNFRDAFTTDVDFVPRLISTISSMLLQLPLILIFAMFGAILLNRPIWGRTMFRGIFFLPVIIASGAVLQKLIDSRATTMPIFAQYDLFSILIQYVPAQILLPLLQALDALTLVMWDSGVQILIFLAGLQSISISLYEAAKCDGATPWESFWKITFPMITPMILVNTLFSIVNSFTKVNNRVMQYISDAVFKKTNYGYAAALGWVYFLIIFLIILLVFFLFRNRAVYAGERR